MLRRIIVVAVVLIVGAAGYAGWRWVISGGPSLDKGFYDGDHDARSEPFTYEPYANVLQTYVDDRGLVDYAALAADRDDLNRFVRSIGWLKPTVFQEWTREEKLAFWINAYNALTLKLVIDHYPIEARPLGQLAGPANSIKQIPNRWSSPFFLVMGKPTSLDEIEHEILREQQKKSAHKQFDEPRIHMALVCAARSCPPLRDEPYEAIKLDEQFDDQSRKFLADSSRFQIDADADQVYLSAIFKWFGGDFVSKYLPPSGFGSHSDSERAVLNYIATFLDEPKTTYLRAGSYKVAYLRYDWTLNEQTQHPPEEPDGYDDPQTEE